ncbi:hypothetical protein RF11_01596 [Thelohanellus kitauei]|uniref:Uncharacterized protein n=1 Tax=Thelohanellus kitauei TaxID=669202 RepID=A0A0C2J1I5_THEKT|nr:hypothetical protein RF11_01596 [Thelohanellus kitauei]
MPTAGQVVTTQGRRRTYRHEPLYGRDNCHISRATSEDSMAPKAATLCLARRCVYYGFSVYTARAGELKRSAPGARKAYRQKSDAKLVVLLALIYLARYPLPRQRHSRDLPPDSTSLSTLSPAIGVSISDTGKHRADVSLFPDGKLEEAWPHRWSSGFKITEDRKAAKGLMCTERALEQLQVHLGPV